MIISVTYFSVHYCFEQAKLQHKQMGLVPTVFGIATKQQLLFGYAYKIPPVTVA